MYNYEAYSPFGSALVPRTCLNKCGPTRGWSDANRQYRYGFNGKEKDFETSSDNYDFGARILDTRLGRWLSLDPLMYAYPSCSPFAGMGNSPILLSDINGKILKIKGTNETVIFENGLLYSEDGNIYIGDDPFINSTYNDLLLLENSQTGLDLVNEIVTKKNAESNTDEVVTIVNASEDEEGNSKGQSSSKYDDESNVLYYDPNKEEDIPTENKGYLTPTFIILAHELAHAESDLNNRPKRDEKWFNYMWKGSYPKVDKDEIYATHIENLIRSELNLPLRTHYTLSITSTTENAFLGNWDIENSRIIDNSGRSLFYTIDTYQKTMDLSQNLDYDVEKYSHWVLIKTPYDYKDKSQEKIEPTANY